MNHLRVTKLVGCAVLAAAAAACAAEREVSDDTTFREQEAVQQDRQFDADYVRDTDARIAESQRRLEAARARSPRGLSATERAEWQWRVEEADREVQASRELCELTRARRFEDWDERKREIERQLATMESAVVQCEVALAPR